MENETKTHLVPLGGELNDLASGDFNEHVASDGELSIMLTEMQSQKNSIVFRVGEYELVMKEGEFLVNGEVIKDTEKVYEGFAEFLRRGNLSDKQTKPTHAFVYFSEEKPKESGKYFWQTKNGYAGCDYFDADSGEFNYPQGWPSNHDEHLQWLKEVNPPPTNTE